MQYQTKKIMDYFLSCNRRMLILALMLFNFSFLPQIAAAGGVDGKATFVANCAMCHGKDGAVSNYGRKLKPFPARNLRALVGLIDRGELRRFIVYGVHGTAMTAKKMSMGMAEINTVIDYILTFRYQPDLKSGKRRYMEICSVCHGIDGRAQTGIGAKNLVESRLSLQEVVHTMRFGRSGTLMTSKRHQLSNTDIADIANYVYTLRNN